MYLIVVAVDPIRLTSYNIIISLMDNVFGSFDGVVVTVVDVSLTLTIGILLVLIVLH